MPHRYQQRIEDINSKAEFIPCSNHLQTPSLGTCGFSGGKFGDFLQYGECCFSFLRRRTKGKFLNQQEKVRRLIGTHVGALETDVKKNYIG
ncbi:hypothetical protein TNIN_94951 [Trichonephila inaurata madagascariensis]|uniref:Uncharacterized protein n=1 Tax=Trichonephila inaurata madagascariensis TaxID=2747483 RepID=A0A8X7BTL1_9ARAC|nr:hypothetical protein TNIN_94951 [Trichonephila inaurata madagascariensis]